MSAEKRIRQLGIELPQAPPPVANYVNAVRSGNLLFLSGKGPSAVDGLRPAGKLGREFNLEQGYKFARSTGLALLAVMRAELGSLDRVKRVVKLLGMVNAVPEFTDQPKVINGCSDLLVEVFGERGRHARSAVGMGSLPSGIPVEIEVVVEVGPAPLEKRKKRAAKQKRAPARKRR
ncbi:MAG: RidA family protein [Burkholderiales bacterium]